RLSYSYCPPYLPVLPSFPTRRSSDLCSNDADRPFIYSKTRVSDFLRADGDPACVRAHVLDVTDAGGPLHYSLHFNALERRMFRVDRKSTRLNSSHLGISYAVFCLKKK